ncbi:MAG TPA: hypothetical protein VNZ53_17475 [Steroidobacteraceae bacterium]|jgi:hypothetical protein|nr:hypothetical protein [Steroidobacteraceae bacterium]
MTMDNDVNFDKDIDIDINFDLKSDVDIKLDKDVNIDVDVHSNADIYGNTATATFSAEAVGNNTLAEADVHVLATDGMSSVDGVLVAAVN